MIKQIMKDIAEHGGSPLVVGGFVRDYLLGIPNKDIDVEVYDMSANKLIDVLKKYGHVDTVGVSFGVIKVAGYDFSLPRRESKQGRGYRGFQVEVDSNLSPYEAALRRDFTINSMGMTPEGEIVDFHGGIDDLENRILKATSTHFVEDPLRVLRGFQFVSRFGLKADLDTIIMCKELRKEYDTLAKERIFEEWIKWTKGNYPNLSLIFLYQTNWIHQYPELFNLIDLPQDPIWHPEGDVWSHTCYVVKAMADICNRENIVGEERAILFFSALLHDVGKTNTTVYDGRWKSPGHDIAGVPLAESFLRNIGCYPKIIGQVCSLVREHMVHVYGQVNLKRLANRIYPSNIKHLLYLIEADHSGRPPLTGGLPEVCKDWLDRCREMEILNNRPKPIISGRHLLDRMVAGPEMGRILKMLYEKQLNGEFQTVEEGLKLI